jgi:transcriptional regulator with XRE-family HTH domain
MEKNIELLKLSENIKAARKKQNLSQEKLAYICDFDRTYISLLERGKRNPSYFNLKKLTKGLNMSLSQLLEDL